MEIKILDGYAMNPGDLSWDALSKLGDLTVYDRTAASEVAERIGNTEIIFTNKTPVTKETMDACPDLKFIGVLATGYNIVDTAAAKERGIVVSNIPAYSTDSVAQLVFAFILEFSSRVASHSESVIRGDWQNCADFSYCLTTLHELKGKTLGIIGYGAIGKAAARIASAFGMKVIACSRSKKSGTDGETVFADMETVFRTADFLTIHCPLTPETTGLINSETIKKMKPTAYLINTSRGPVADENALADALNKGIIAGAGIDVVSVEPVRPDNPLLKAKNILITPHIGWSTQEARTRAISIAGENLKAFLRGEPVNTVN